MKARFPVDLLVVSGLPLMVVMLLISGAFSLCGIPWVVVFGGGMMVSLTGALLLFKAKLPAYREGKFCTIGASIFPKTAGIFTERAFC
jgi:hypothetical protein